MLKGSNLININIFINKVDRKQLISLQMQQQPIRSIGDRNLIPGYYSIDPQGCVIMIGIEPLMREIIFYYY